MTAADLSRLTRKLMTKMIQRLGHHTQVAENGRMALDIIRRAHAANDESTPSLDIVFLDK